MSVLMTMRVGFAFFVLGFASAVVRVLGLPFFVVAECARAVDGVIQRKRTALVARSLAAELERRRLRMVREGEPRADA